MTSLVSITEVEDLLCATAALRGLGIVGVWDVLLRDEIPESGLKEALPAHVATGIDICCHMPVRRIMQLRLQST